MDLFAAPGATVMVLLAMRITGLVLVAPVFSSRTVPMRLRTGVLIVLSALMFPVAFSGAPGELALTPALALSEALIGFAIGLGAAVLVGAAEMMGNLLAINIGLSGAAALDPLNNESSPVLGNFANLFTVTLLLSMDAHLAMLQALGSSLRLFPPGAPLMLRAGAGTMVAAFGHLFALGLQFAAPVIAVILLANIALGILSRAAPQMGVLAVAFPMHIGVGLFALSSALPMVAAALVGWRSEFQGLLDGFFRAFQPPAAP